MMPKRFQVQNSEPSITTIAGLKKEVSTSIVRYFAPLVAVYREFSATAGMPTVTWWQKHEVDKDRGRDPPGQ
jgi:hypothetical protein